MRIYYKIKNKEENLCVIGLGYVGLPLAINFAKKVKVIGFDINKEKISKYKDGIDVTKELGNNLIKNTTCTFTSNEKMIKECKFHIVAVPTPVKQNKPDLKYLTNACKILGRNLVKGSIIVFESTVYPGVTEQVCVPILEENSGLIVGKDFKVGYSPERVNPGDKINTLENIIKVVSGMDDETLEEIAKVYELIIKKGVYKVNSIKIAESCKILENIQRDLNIALMNEVCMVFKKLDIDFDDVLKACQTKWNFLNFHPGLVGGHCIGIDTIYFIDMAKQLGFESKLLLETRRVNDGMVKFVFENIFKILKDNVNNIEKSKVTIFGFSFKENCSDVRNTQIDKLIKEFENKNINNINVVDPLVNVQEAYNKYGIKIKSIKDVSEMNILIFAIPHNLFLNLTFDDLDNMYNKYDKKILIDLQGIFDKNEAKKRGYIYWKM